MPADAQKPAKFCEACGFNMGRYQTGNEIACADCDGRLCERCCDKKLEARDAR